MKPWTRIAPSEYRALPLRAHETLEAFPLHDAWRVELPGGGTGRTIEDVRQLFTVENLASINPVVKLLFGLRAVLGRTFRWDGEPPTGSSLIDLLTDEERRASSVEPGSPDGPFRVLYVADNESVSEARNATVHAFSVLHLCEGEDGYRLHWAIHVKPVGRITGYYMAAIDPFRRFLIYPAVLAHVRRTWTRRYGGDTP